ncbi:MAG TPA: patatin-like phospholipase family protein, partial [Nitrospira sp.]|nr:patatin-like phospholipase family protein [Nitrospira sp.]
MLPRLALPDRTRRNLTSGYSSRECQSVGEGLLEVVHQFLEPLLDLWQVLKLCRFAVLTIGLAAFFLISAPQGQEVLVHLQTQKGPWLGQNISFFVIVVVWAWMVWYWCRFILSFRFRDWPPSGPPERLRLIHLYNHVVPRALGVTAILVVAVAFLASLDGRTASGIAWGNGGFYLIVAALFGYFTLKWRPSINRLRRKYPRVRRMIRPSRPDPPMSALYQQYSNLPVGVRRTMRWSFVALFLTPLVIFQIPSLNISLPPMVGPAFIVLLAAAAWVSVGTWIIYMAKWHRLPVLTMLFVYAASISTCNDNHGVRRIVDSTKRHTAKVDLIKQFDTWARHRAEQAPPDTIVPIFLIAAEGGGIRAAYWTAAILSRIQADHPDFADHVFVLSGVSGGSLGAAVFAALLAGDTSPGPCQDPKAFAGCAHDVLTHDYLSSTLGMLLYPDLLQRFFFLPIDSWDRGRMMELSWERRWDEVRQGSVNLFASPFEHLWSNSNGRHVPNLIFNMTAVENGKRVLFSNLRLSQSAPTTNKECIETWTGMTHGPFDDAVDLSEALNLRHCPQPSPTETMRLSTAVHNSARFSFISPAGTVNDRLHLVDGGYFENSGMTTLEEVYGQITLLINERAKSQQGPRIVP